MNSITVQRLPIHRFAGFSLIELMIVLAILAILVGTAVPAYNNYVVRAKVTEGLAFLGASKSDIAEFQATQGRLPENFEELGFGTASGAAFGGDAGSFQEVFGVESDIWRQVEWQPKSGGWILVLRSKQKPLWDNIDIGLHLQVKAENGLIRFRCVVNDKPFRKAWVPPNCRQGGVNEWGW